MRNFECALCGKSKLAEDWPYCNNGHEEFGMYEVLHWDHATRKELMGRNEKTSAKQVI